VSGADRCRVRARGCSSHYLRNLYDPGAVGARLASTRSRHWRRLWTCLGCRVNGLTDVRGCNSVASATVAPQARPHAGTAARRLVCTDRRSKACRVCPARREVSLRCANCDSSRPANFEARPALRPGKIMSWALDELGSPLFEVEGSGPNWTVTRQNRPAAPQRDRERVRGPESQVG